jgi:inner membrane protease subunit 1
LAAVKTFFIAHLLMEYGFEAAPSWGASMLPTFPIMGNVTIQSKRYRRGRGIEVGDIVAYYKPSEPGEKVIKRVIGLEGDYVLRNTPGSGSDQMIQVIIALANFILYGNSWANVYRCRKVISGL